MADEPEQPSTLPFDIAWNILMAAAVGVVAFIVWDIASNGKATDQIRSVFTRTDRGATNGEQGPGGG